MQKAVVSHLQYADNTLFIGEVCVENLWTMKAILRWFELISGLKVNFFKSRLFGVNVCNAFKDQAASFLHCKKGNFPFVYLGLPVGENPRKASTCVPVVKAIEKRLLSWKNKYVSLGGRVVLINSVLYSIPIFYLSFLKMSSSVWKTIVKLQRHFLWGDVLGESGKISWVKWEDVCRPKQEGGLGVKNLMLFNLSLLDKWHWRILTERDSQWSAVLAARYRDGVAGDWVEVVFVKKLGNGGNTSFWNDIWCESSTSREAFPRLFHISLQPQVTIKEMGEWVNDSWRWLLEWRRAFFVWEESLYGQLMGALESIPLSHVDDSWEFRLDSGGCLGELALSKVVVFSWQLLLGHLLSRVNLAKRSVIPNKDQMCGLCGSGRYETEDHLFLLCPFAWRIWMEVYNWFGLVEVLPENMGTMFLPFFRAFKSSKKVHKGIVMLWQAVVWVI
ncbi:ribonuclease H [Trifolium pratense]|uniref:Ribonuclease H n=1 Tax=Trifolium pratense TaxID=57577 RepID=A0A2K3PDJ7_TRIPR|nr:ribonuclease H [Trifolium pratense]